MLNKVIVNRCGLKHGLFIFPLCLALSACTSGENAVKEAAQQRWNALVSGDFYTAYQFYTDAFKETVPLEHYKNKVAGVGLWNKAQVREVKCDAANARCEADVEVTVAMKMRGLPKPVETSDVVQEIWIKEGVFSDWRYMKK